MGKATGMTVVIDYGAGNLRSVLHALKRLGVADARVIRSSEEAAALLSARRVILPGVGAFGAALAQLRATGLTEPLREAIAAGRPYLGICLGMQFLFEGSEEAPGEAGLAILPGQVRRFAAASARPVPHMGWNQLRVRRPSPLLKGIPAAAYAYFVHSYYCAPANEDDTLLSADYGGPFCAAIQRENLFATQFHPEKSQRVGLRLLANFLEWSA